ncbi:hypothetical protein ACSMXN_04025 [Jatrophihabitans sp. DSM 45814]
MSVAVRAISDSDLPAVGEFLHTYLNPRVSAEAWARAPMVPWPDDGPNHGFLLTDEDAIVGVYLALYATRTIDGVDERFCNLGAWCVREDYRSHSVRLIRSLLAQKDYTFTDLSPSGTVVPLNERLKFEHLDTATVLIPGVPLPSRPFSSAPDRIHIRTDRRQIEAALTGTELKLYRDHAAAAAAHHLLITRGSDACYVIYRRDRRKNLPVFASILYVSNPEIFRAGVPRLSSHLLLRHGVLATLAELRVVSHRPRLSKLLSDPRRKMFKSSHLSPSQIDYLYSELVCVAW